MSWVPLVMVCKFKYPACHGRVLYSTSISPCTIFSPFPLVLFFVVTENIWCVLLQNNSSYLGQCRVSTQIWVWVRALALTSLKPSLPFWASVPSFVKHSSYSLPCRLSSSGQLLVNAQNIVPCIISVKTCENLWSQLFLFHGNIPRYFWLCPVFLTCESWS